MLIPPLTSEDASDAQRAVFALVRQRFGRDLPPVTVMARHEQVMGAVTGFEMAIQGADRLPARLAHLVNLKVAALLGCAFCIDIGTHLARDGGASARAVTDLPRFRDSDAYTAAERAALAAAEAMTTGDGVLGAALEDELRGHFDAEQLVELLAVIAWENFRSRFNRAAGLQAAGFCPVGERAAVERDMVQVD